MASNAKNLAELLNTDTTVAVADVADGSITTAKLAADAVTTAKIADDAVSSAKLFATNLGRRNVIINGAMQVAQRGTSATGRGASSNFLVDRFRANHNGNSAGRYTVSQVSDVHDGFTTALKYDCTTADTSIGSSERFFIEYPMEGQDLQQFRKGSSDAKDFVVSFYAKANGNFTYVVGFYDADNNRTVSRTFAVTSSWQRFTINFGADTSGAFGNDNALSLQLRWYLHAGSGYTSASLQTSWNAVNNAATAGGMTSSFFSSTDNTFFLTGVQLEVGDKSDGTSVATDFEHRSFAEEFALCERYFFTTYNYGATIGAASSASYLGRFLDDTQGYGSLQVPTVAMRASPTRVIYNPSTGTTGQARTDTTNVAAAITATDVKGGGWIYVNNSSVGKSVSLKAHITMDAEL